MEVFDVYSGKSVPLLNDNIDTDQLIPKSYLKRIEKTGFGKWLFDDWRYLPNRKPNPEFVLNFPEYKNATILIAGENFGSGSSREHAAWALQDYGFKAVIAGSFSDIFYMNALKNGLLPIALPSAVRQKLAQLNPDMELTIDLAKQTVIADDDCFPFEIASDWKHKLLNGLDEIESTLYELEKIEAYEQTIPNYG